MTRESSLNESILKNLLKLLLKMLLRYKKETLESLNFVSWSKNCQPDVHFLNKSFFVIIEINVKIIDSLKKESEN